MHARSMHGWAYHLTTLLLAGVALMLFWSTQTPWATAGSGTTRIDVGLLGVSSGEGRCGWYDVEPVSPGCAPAPGAGSGYALLQVAPVAIAFAIVAFVLAAFAHLRRGSGLTGTGLAPFAILSAGAMVAAIMLVRFHAADSLAALAGQALAMNAPGMTAAWGAAALLIVAAALSRYSFIVVETEP